MGRPHDVTEPPAPPLCLVVRRRTAPDGATVVALAGELDLTGEEQVREAVMACRGERVVVDLSGLELIDARGVAALLEADRLLAEAGGSMQLRGARGIVDLVLTTLHAKGLLDGLLEPR